jgi:NitT/TauT family transport system permease protein
VSAEIERTAIRPAAASGAVARPSLSSRLETPLWLVGTGVLLVLLWEAFARFGGMNPLVFVGPSSVAAALVADTLNGQIPMHLAASGLEFAYGYLLALVLAVPFGLLVGATRRLELALSPYLVGLYALPVLAWLPVLITWFGIGLLAKVLLIFLICFLTIALNVMAGVKTVDPVLVKVGHSFGASRLELFSKLVLPSTLPFIVAGLRLAVGRGILAVFLAEMVGASVGIGFYILRSGSDLRIANVFAGVLLMAIPSVVLTEGIRYLEERLTPWRPRV